MGPEAMRLLAQTSAEGLELLLHTLSRLQKSRRVSNRCSFFAWAAGGIFIPRAKQ